MTTLQLYVASPVQAHEALTGLYRGVVKPHTRAGGAGIITWQTHSSALRLKHRGAFHGHILKAFSEQVWFQDAAGRRFRYSKEVWKHFLKSQFLPSQMEEYTSRAGEVKVRKRRPSTEDLSDDEYQRFLDEVIAFGITELGIDFDESGQ